MIPNRMNALAGLSIVVSLLASGCNGGSTPAAKPPSATPAANANPPVSGPPVAGPPVSGPPVTSLPGQPPVVSFAPPAANPDPIGPTPPVGTQSPAPAPSPANPPLAQNPAAVELKDSGKKNFGGGAIMAPIVVPVEAYFSARNTISALNLAHHLEIYKAEHESYPKSHEEFMENVIKANSLSLPKLPEGCRYQYDPKDAKLYVVKPAEPR